MTLFNYSDNDEKGGGRENTTSYEGERRLEIAEEYEQNAFVSSTENMQTSLAIRNAEQHVDVGFCLDEPLKMYLKLFFEAKSSAIDQKISCVVEVQKETRKDIIEVNEDLQCV